MSREIYERKLGPARDFVYNNTEQRGILRQWAIAIGTDPIAAYALTVPQLTNLYHERGPGATAEKPNPYEIPRPGRPWGSAAPSPAVEDAAALTKRIVDAMYASNMIGMDALRQTVREEIPTSDALRALAQEVYDALPPRRLEVSSANGIARMDGAIHHMTELVISIAALGHPIMLVGPAGCGKTTIGEHVARALNLPFFITSTVIDTHELMGFIDGHGTYHSTPFRQAFEHGGVWVADEIDAWDAAALLTANSALANGFATFPDAQTPVARHAQFRMVATANTFGHGADRIYVGRNELDAASLDRFATINIDYDIELERRFAGGQADWLHYVWKMRERVNEKKIRHVVSSRAIIMGGAALSAGIPLDVVRELYLFKGMSKTDREKVK